MTPTLRILALLFVLSGCLGAAVGCGSCGFALGYWSGIIPQMLKGAHAHAHVGSSSGQVAAAYFAAALILAGSAAPQWVAAWALMRGRPWARSAALLASVAGLASCLPVGLLAFFLTWRMAPAKPALEVGA